MYTNIEESVCKIIGFYMHCKRIFFYVYPECPQRSLGERSGFLYGVKMIFDIMKNIHEHFRSLGLLDD